MDPFNVAGRELLAIGWLPGLLVGGSLGWASWDGQVGPLRSSLGLLATAATVVIVLGSDAFRQGSERGFGAPVQRVFGGTAVWVMVAGVIGVVLAAASLPWLGPPRPWFSSRPGEAVFVGVVGFVLGVVLGAPLALASSEAMSRRREDAHTRDESPPPERSTGTKVRAGEFVADPDDPFRNDTLGRREQVKQFCERVQEMATPVVWAVEGAWGTGKTAFSRMCTAVLRNEPGVAAVIPVNALTQGATGAPLIDLAVAVGRALESAARDRTEGLERRRRRSRLADLAEALSEPAILLREFGRGDTPAADTVGEMAGLVGQYVDSTPGLVVVWIDELDRCPPEYALGILRFTAPETYRGATTRVWASQKSASEFFQRTLAETGGSFGHVARWPAAELAAAMARVATRQSDGGMRFEEIVEIVGLSGVMTPAAYDRVVP